MESNPHEKLCEPDEAAEPNEAAYFVGPKRYGQQVLAALDDAAGLYHAVLMSNEDRFKTVREYLAHRGVGKETICAFNIGYAPPYSDDQCHGRALISSMLPRVEKDPGTVDAISDAGLIRFLNDGSMKASGRCPMQGRVVEKKRADASCMQGPLPI